MGLGGRGVAQSSRRSRRRKKKRQDTEGVFGEIRYGNAPPPSCGGVRATGDGGNTGNPVIRGDASRLDRRGPRDPRTSA